MTLVKFTWLKENQRVHYDRSESLSFCWCLKITSNQSYVLSSAKLFCLWLLNLQDMIWYMGKHISNNSKFRNSPKCFMFPTFCTSWSSAVMNVTTSKWLLGSLKRELLETVLDICKCWFCLRSDQDLLWNIAIFIG